MSLERESRREQIVRTLWEIEFKHINDYFPAERKSLEELLKEDEPSVKSMGGGRIYFRKEDLEYLASLVPKRFHRELCLPFTIIRQSGWRKGTYAVKGGKLEIFTIHKLIGLIDKGFEDYWRIELKPYVYRAQLLELMRKVPSLVSIGFFLEEGEEIE